jgi:hypothetical protein
MEAQESGIIAKEGSNAVNSLARSVGQQLERSGLLQRLPNAITAAAQQLQQLQDRPELITAGLKDSPAGGLSLEVPAATSQLTSTHMHLQQLLSMLLTLQSLWPQGELEVRIWPALAPSLMQLHVGVLQHVSVCLDQLSGDQEPPVLLLGLLAQAIVVADCVAMPAALQVLGPDMNPDNLRPQQQQGGRQQQQQQQQTLQGIRQELLQSPCACQAVCLMMVVNSYGSMLLQQIGTLPGNGTNSSCSSNTGSSSHEACNSAATSRRADRAPATAATSADDDPTTLPHSLRCSWQLACSRHHLLPAAHDSLLQTLSCSSKAVLLAAAIAASFEPGSYRPTRSLPAQSVLLEAYMGLVKLRQPLVEAEISRQPSTSKAALAQLARWADRTSQGEQQQQQEQPCVLQSAAEQKMHLLLPSVLLLNAAETPSSGPDAAVYFQMCYMAATIGLRALTAWQQQEDMLNARTAGLEVMRLVQSLWQRVPGTTAPEQPMQLHAKAQYTAYTTLDLQLVASQVVETLHVVRFILTNLMEMCRADPSSEDHDYKAYMAYRMQYGGSAAARARGGFPLRAELHVWPGRKACCTCAVEAGSASSAATSGWQLQCRRGRYCCPQ